jgi:hypothetical protein
MPGVFRGEGNPDSIIGSSFYYSTACGECYFLVFLQKMKLHIIIKLKRPL